MSVFQPPPTWELLIVEDPLTKQPIFSPVWLKWFVDLTKGTTGGGSGSGDVVGPGSSTSGAVALFSGATGKLLTAVSGLGDSSQVLTGNATGAPTWATPSIQRSFMLMGA